MVLIVVGIVFALAALATLLLRQKRKAERHKQRQGKRAPGKGRTQREPLGPYAAVSVKPSSDSCSTAFEISNLRYLQSSAPSLPISGCNNSDCQCSFIHHPDRRSSDDDEDRRMGIGLQTQLYGANGEENRRENRRGRRRSDRH